MPHNFKTSQLLLQDMASATPGTIGWFVSNRQEQAKLIMIVTRQISGTPECVFVELEGEHSFTARRIGNIGRGNHFMLKLPQDEWSVELGNSFRSAGGHGDIGSLILTESETYLSVMLGNSFGETERYFVRLSDFVMDDDWPNGMRSVIGSWKMVAGDGEKKVVLAESQERT